MTECGNDRKNEPNVSVETDLQNCHGAEASRFSMFVYALIVLALVVGMVAVVVDMLPNAFQNIMNIFKGMQ